MSQNDKFDGLGELVYPNFWINFGTNSEKGRNWSGLCWDQFPEQKIVKLCEQDQWFKIGLELFPTQFSPKRLLVRAQYFGQSGIGRLSTIFPSHIKL